jgi:hypothetical protein
MQQPLGQRAVVRQQQETARVEVETPDRIEPVRDVAQQVPHRRAPLGIGERAHHPARLVQHDRARPSGPRDRLSVDGDHVAHRIGAHPERADDDAVHLHAAGPDQLLRVPP